MVDIVLSRYGFNHKYEASDFTTERSAEVQSGRSPLTNVERQLLIDVTTSFKECSLSTSELSAMTDVDLMTAAYTVWSGYASRQQ